MKKIEALEKILFAFEALEVVINTQCLGRIELIQQMISSTDDSKDQQLTHDLQKLILRIQNIRKTPGFLELSQIVEGMKTNPQEDYSSEEVSSTAQKITDHLDLITIDDDFAQLVERYKNAKKIDRALSGSRKGDPTKKTLSDSDADWFNEQTIKKVSKKLRELAQEDGSEDTKKVSLAQTLEENWAKFEELDPTEKAAVKKIMRQVISFPGFGHIEPEKTDTYMSAEEIRSELERVSHSIQSANMIGMGSITDVMQTIYSNKLSNRFSDDPDTIGAAIETRDTQDKQVIKPYFWGPPGTGKTMVARKCAQVFDQPLVYLSAEKIKKVEDIFGFSGQWQGGAKMGPVAEAMAATGRTDLFIFIDELDKISPDILLQLTNFLGNPPSYEDAGLGVTVDLSRCTFFIAGNKVSVLETIEHLDSRLDTTYFPGYTEEQQEQILKLKIFRLLSKNGYHNNICFSMGEQFDDSWVSKDPVFKGFRKSDPNALLYLVQNYSTEAGVREIERELTKVIQAAKQKSLQRKDGDEPVVINAAFIEEALGAPDPKVKKIKDLDKKISDQMQEFDQTIHQLEDVQLDELAETVKLEELIRRIEIQFTTLVQDEENIIKLLQQRLSNPKAKQKRIKEQIEYHQSSIEDIKKRYGLVKKQKIDQNPDLRENEQRLEADQKTTTLLTSPSAHTITEAFNGSITQHGQTTPTGTSISATTLTTTKPTGPSVIIHEQDNYGTSPSVTVTGPDSFGSVAFRLSKVQGKRNAGPKRSFEDFCTHATQIIEERDQFLKDPLIASKAAEFNALPYDSEADKAAQEKWLAENMKDSRWQSRVTGKKHGDQEKYSAAEHFKHSVNTAYIYQSFNPQIQKSTEGKITGLSLHDQSRGQTLQIERSAATKTTTITSTLPAPNTRDVQIMAEWIQQRCPMGGQCTLNDWGHIPNEALRLFLSVKALGREPTFDTQTLQAVREYCSTNPQDPLVVLYNKVITSKMSDVQHIKELLQTLKETDQTDRAKPRHP